MLWGIGDGWKSNVDTSGGWQAVFSSWSTNDGTTRKKHWEGPFVAALGTVIWRSSKWLKKKRQRDQEKSFWFLVLGERVRWERQNFVPIRAHAWTRRLLCQWSGDWLNHALRAWLMASLLHHWSLDPSVRVAEVTMGWVAIWKDAFSDSTWAILTRT